jgi:hypothetical protein
VISELPVELKIIVGLLQGHSPACSVSNPSPLDGRSTGGGGGVFFDVHFDDYVEDYAW